jgi:thiol:disulfide interchange protein
LIATDLAVVGVEAEVDYPRGIDRRFAFADQPIRVYEGEITLPVRFNSAPPDRITLRVTYQPCTDTTCLPAVTKQVELVSG